MTDTGREQRERAIGERLESGHRLFYVQREPRSVWHIESVDDPEMMLCGEVISVEEPHSKVQTRPGPKPCLWCARYLANARSYSLASSGSPFPRARMISSPAIQTTLRDVTTRTGDGS